MSDWNTVHNRADRDELLTVVLRPPGEVTAADDVVEDERDDRPGDVVDRARGRDVADAGEDDGEVDVLDDAVRPLERDGVRRAGEERADEEEEHEPVVDLPARELPLRADDAPDDRRRPEDGRAGADEAVRLRGRAHVLDVREHPCLDAELHRARDDRGDDLRPEHRAGSGRRKWVSKSWRKEILVWSGMQ